MSKLLNRSNRYWIWARKTIYNKGGAREQQIFRNRCSVEKIEQGIVKQNSTDELFL